MRHLTLPRLAAAVLVTATLSACATTQYGQPVVPTNVRNAALGAGAGAVAAKAFDGDVKQGALAGAAAGALACDIGMAYCPQQ